AKTGLGRGGSRGKVADVALFRCARAAHRAAVDPRGQHSDEEPAVEARIAGEPRPRTDLAVEFHRNPYTYRSRLLPSRWTYSDLDFAVRIRRSRRSIRRPRTSNGLRHPDLH